MKPISLDNIYSSASNYKIHGFIFIAGVLFFMKFLFALIFLTVTTYSQAASVNGFDLKFYGFLKASSIYSTQALASYNNVNLSAPTHAVAQKGSQDSSSRMSFQTQQSRMGVILEKEKISSKLEFDFIDFSKSSPTTQMNPRVRIASVTYKMDHSTLIAGQDWDLFSPVNSYTFDIVGLYFMAGNTGFMRQQFQYLYHPHEWEFGAAVGMAGNNPKAGDDNLELSKSPSYSGRITRKLENGRIGLSGIYAHLNYPFKNGRGHDAYAGNFFYEQVIGSIGIKSELYYGQNLNNIGALAIGKGTDSSDVKEFGGTLSGQLKVTDQNFLFGGVGLAKVDNRSQLAAFELDDTTKIITAPGVRQNFISRIGWDYRITPDFSWMTEVTRFDTISKMTPDKYETNVVGSLESGIQLRF